MGKQLAFGFKGTLFSIFIWLIIVFSIILAITYKVEISSIFDKTRIPEVISRVFSEIYSSKAYIGNTGEVRINKGAANQYLVEEGLTKKLYYSLSIRVPQIQYLL